MNGRTAALVAAGAAAGAAGVLAVGVASGLAAERRAVRARRTGPDPEAQEPFGALPAARTGTVYATDGVELYVEEVGPQDAPLSVVFVHGLANDLGCWHYQRRDLWRSEGFAAGARAVFYDQRGHGRSGVGATEQATLEQLAQDLRAVLDQWVPEGPLVLVGHSMGGMTIQELLAENGPELHGRLVGIALLSTSAGALTAALLGPLARFGGPLLPDADRRLMASPTARRSTVLADAGRRRGSDLSVALTWRFAFGDYPVSPSLLEYVTHVVSATPLEVVLDLVPTILEHDRLEALARWDTIPVLVVCGEQDLLTPASHSQAIAEALSTAEFVAIPGAGHMAHMQRPGYVTVRLGALIRDAVAAARSPGLVRRLVETADECRALGTEVAELALQPGDLVVLTGPLGAGKTVFAQGVGRGLGATGEITSPTFVIAREHPEGRVPMVHVDAYRLGDVSEVDDLDLDTDLADSVLLVEWGEGLVEPLASDRLEVRIDRTAAAASDDVGSGGVRRVDLVPVGESWRARLAALRP